MTNFFYKGEVFKVNLGLSTGMMTIIFENKELANKFLSLYEPESEYFYESSDKDKDSHSPLEMYVMGILTSPHTRLHPSATKEMEEKYGPEIIERYNKAVQAAVSVQTSDHKGGRIGKDGQVYGELNEMRLLSKKYWRNYNLKKLGV